MAVGILDQSSAAQNAAIAHDQTAALSHIQQAQALAGEILQALPSRSAPVLIEVKRQVQTTSTYVDVKHKHGEMNPDRLKKNTTVAQVNQQVIASMLDVTSAQQHLANAQNDIQLGNWMAAQTELGAIPQSVIETKVDGDVPLLRAQQNLELARSRILDGKAKAAAGPLRAAADALGEFDQLFPGPHVQASQYMQQEIRLSAENVARNDTLNRINVMWLPSIRKWEKEGGAHVAAARPYTSQ